MPEPTTAPVPLPCSLCGGTRITPGSEDYDPDMHMHNPSTGEPCDCRPSTTAPVTAERTIPKPIKSAYALTAFRVLPNGDGRWYSATTFPKDPWQGCERMIRTGFKLGFLIESNDGYAVLDVLNEDGDIVQDFTIRDAHAFQYFKRKLHWCVEEVPTHG